MSSAILAGIISLVETAVTETPQLISEFQTLFNKSTITPVDWELLRTKIQSDSFATLAPDVKL